MNLEYLVDGQVAAAIYPEDKPYLLILSYKDQGMDTAIFAESCMSLMQIIKEKITEVSSLELVNVRAREVYMSASRARGFSLWVSDAAIGLWHLAQAE